MTIVVLVRTLPMEVIQGENPFSPLAHDHLQLFLFFFKPTHDAQQKIYYKK
jgi:hypothetical protein